MVENGYNILCKKFQEKYHGLDINKQQQFHDFQLKYEEADKDTIKDIKEKVEILILNNSRR